MASPPTQPTLSYVGKVDPPKSCGICGFADYDRIQHAIEFCSSTIVAVCGGCVLDIAVNGAVHVDVVPRAKSK